MSALSSEDNQIETMIQALDSPDWDIRSVASDNLIAIGSAAYPALMGELQGSSMRRAVSAARILAAQQDPQVHTLMKHLMMSDNPLLGQIAVEYIARQSEAEENLLGCLKQSSYMVQISIVQALGNIGASGAFTPLVELLQRADVGSTLKLTIVRALGMIGDNRAVEYLHPLLNTTDEHFSKRVRQALDLLTESKQLNDERDSTL